ncbi:hypothetical protein [Geopseudomonas aromaticivorans]
MFEQEETQAEVRAELLEHLRFELNKAQASYEKNVREGFPEAADSWLPAIGKWQRMMNFVEKTKRL